MKLTSAFFLTLGTSAAFTSPVKYQHRIPRLFVASSNVEETFYQAVQLAEQGQKEIDIQEMDRLATELEQFQGCNYEEEADLCDKEIQDRIDVAEILRLQIELQLRCVGVRRLECNVLCLFLLSHTPSDWIISRAPTCLPTT